MSAYEYLIPEAVSTATSAKGISLEEVFEAVNAPSYNQVEYWWGDTIVHVLAEISGGRRLVVSCYPDRYTNRRSIYSVRDMDPSLYAEFIRRSR